MVSDTLSCRVSECLNLARHKQSSKGRAILLALLPRAVHCGAQPAQPEQPSEQPPLASSGGNGSAAASGGSNRSSRITPAPYSQLAPAIEAVNSGLRQLAERTSRAYYLDCGQALLEAPPGGLAGRSRLAPALMPDGCTPNAAGLRRVALCLAPLIETLMTQPPPLRTTAYAHGSGGAKAAELPQNGGV